MATGNFIDKESLWCRPVVRQSEAGKRSAVFLPLKEQTSRGGHTLGSRGREHEAERKH